MRQHWIRKQLSRYTTVISGTYNDPEQVVHAKRASVTKRRNLASGKGWWCRVIGKFTVMCGIPLVYQPTSSENGLRGDDTLPITINVLPEADLGMFSMFGRTGAPQKGGPHKRTGKFLSLRNIQ